MLEDTIIAVSTPIGYGGLGVVRLSGRKALAIAKRIFRLKGKKGSFLPRRPILGNLFDFENKELYEEAYLTYFPGPRSYTAEDVVEISCHGSPVVLEETVRLGIIAGARHADRGEFTLRAYLKGRIDILQAEAVNDIIKAPSIKQARISFRQMEGSLSERIRSLRAKIVHILSQAEAGLEFPDEGLRISSRRIAKTLNKALSVLESLISSYDVGRTLSEGIELAIIGRTNVGKSTLFNALLGKERAIVTPYPGTTRDYLSERIKINDSVFSVIDMAGLDHTHHPIEKEGIKRGKRVAGTAEGILLVLDVSRKESREDIALLRKYVKRKAVIVFNKSDLPHKMDIPRMIQEARGLPSIEISALKGSNIDRLSSLIHSRFAGKSLNEGEVVLHLRQKLLLEEIRAALLNGLKVLEDGYSEEIFVEEIRKALPPIGQLTGEVRDDEVLEEIFGRFCVGK